MRYQVVLHRTDEGISVSVPALPGCWSEGNTDEEALANIRDAIDDYLAALRDTKGGMFVQYRGWNKFAGPFLICLIAIFWTPFFSGCGGKDGPPFGQVMGKVTLDGQPIQSGMVMFIPDSASGTVGPASQAQIGSGGEYELMGPGGRKGAVVGTHRITVSGPEVSSDSAGKSASRVRVPERYKHEQSSGIKKEVLAGENTIHIELTSE